VSSPGIAQRKEWKGGKLIFKAVSKVIKSKTFHGICKEKKWKCQLSHYQIFRTREIEKEEGSKIQTSLLEGEEIRENGREEYGCLDPPKGSFPASMTSEGQRRKQ